MDPAPIPENRPTTAANDAEREAQVTQIIIRLERLLAAAGLERLSAEAAELREELARLKSGTHTGAAKGSE